MNIYFYILNLILDIVFIVIISVFFYDEFLFEKEKLQVKEYFKKSSNIIKPVVLFIGVFIVTFLILFCVRFIIASAAETDYSDNNLEEVASEEYSSESETYTLDDEMTSVISSEVESILSDVELGSEEDSETETEKNNSTIIVYQVPVQETQAITEVNYYDSLDDYLNNEKSVLSYADFIIVRRLSSICIMLCFLSAISFIIMIAEWRKSR